MDGCILNHTAIIIALLTTLYTCTEGIQEFRTQIYRLKSRLFQGLNDTCYYCFNMRGIGKLKIM